MLAVEPLPAPPSPRAGEEATASARAKLAAGKAAPVRQLVSLNQKEFTAPILACLTLDARLDAYPAPPQGFG